MAQAANRSAAGGQAEAARPLTLGTAGHIDHGKTTLVKALTGKDTDRLREEKERGISIELGFAELVLPSGRHLSIVDVPGHERFVKNMVSGATGIDLFLLVVAADDAVMPQTREHLRIIELLGIPDGVVALTKIDAVEPGMVELAAADVEEFLAGTRYSGAPIIPVSGVTSAGLPELLAAIDEKAAALPPRAAYRATRMPIDRVFSLRGIGTVVTGTLWSGELRTEDVVAVLPSSGEDLQEVRIRGIQVHDRPAEVAGGGQRVALNLTGVERQAVRRGRWIVKDPTVQPTYLVDVAVRLLAEAPAPLDRVSRVRIDHGTQEVLAKLVLADREALEPGGVAYAQIRFEEEVLVYPGDQFIVRSLTPVTTIGGGRVFDPAPKKHGTDPRWRERLRVLEEGPGDAVADLLLREAFPRGIPRRRLEDSPYLWRFDAERAVRDVLSDGRASAGAAGSAPAPPSVAAAAAAVPGGAAVLFHGPSLTGLRERILDVVRERAQSDPLNRYFTHGDLRRILCAGQEWLVLEAALDLLAAEGEIVRSEHGISWAQAAAAPEGKEAEAAERLLAALGAGGVEVSGVEQAAAQAGMDAKEGLRLAKGLERMGRVVRVGEDLYYPAELLAETLAKIVVEIEKEGQVTLAQVRDLLGTSRRYAQALLEHMDSEGMTLRVGDARRLRRRRR